MFKVIHFSIICDNNKKEHKWLNCGVLIEKIVLNIVN